MAALLSRLASLTKVQTAALCLVLAATPVGWQQHHARLAREDAAAAQLAVEAARTQQEELASEVARLRSQSTRLDDALAQATAAHARTQNIVSKDDALKARLFGLLTAADYRWPEDLDFVRIPKSAVKDLHPILAVDVAGKIKDWGAELLGLTPEEKQRAEAALQAHAQALSQLAANRAYETNPLPASLATHWPGKPCKSIWVPPLGADAQPLMADLLAQIGDALGEERAQLLLGAAATGKAAYSQWGKTVGGLYRGTLFTVCVNPDQPDGLEYGQYQDAVGRPRAIQEPESITP